MAEKKQTVKKAPQGVTVALAVAIDDFISLTLRRRNKAQNTQVDYRYVLRRFGAFLTTQGCHSPQEIDPDALDSYVDYLFTNRGNSPNTIAKVYTVVGEWLDWLIEEERTALTSAQLRRFMRGKPQKTHTYPTTDWEGLHRLILRILQEAMPPLITDKPQQRLLWLRRRALYALFWSTGARISEVLSIPRSVIDRHEESAFIRVKGGDRRSVYISDEAHRACAAYVAERRDSCPALFVTHDTRAARAVCADDVQKMMVQDAQDAGVAGVTPHKIRHLVARSILKSTGGNMALVQEVLGHKSIATTQMNYAKFADEDVKTLIGTYHPAFNPNAGAPRKKK